MTAPRRGAEARSGSTRVRRVTAGLVAAALLAPAAFTPAVFADTEIVLPTTVAAEPAGEFEAEVGPVFDLALDEAITQALQHNVSIVVQRYNHSRTLLGIEEALGIYDFVLDANVGVRENSRPTNSDLENADILSTEDYDWGVSLSRLLPWGGTAELALDNGLTESSNRFTDPNPQYSANWNFGLNQPLLRDFGRIVTDRNILVARNNAEINHEAFRLQVQSVVQQVSDVYWDLVGAKEQLAVAEESLELARELHEMNRIQVDVGTKAPLEMVQSEAGVARREEDIIRRRQAVEDAEDRLRRLINVAAGRLWDVPIVPVTGPEFEHRPIDVEEAVALAFANRADVIQQRIDNQIREIDLEVAENGKLPRLDLVAGYGLNAIAGEFRDDDGVIIRETDYGDAIESILDREFNGWQISLNFSMPLENRTARARAAQARLFLEQGLWELRDLEGEVRLDVRRTARAVETANKAIESARVSSRLAEKNLEAERKRYENGLSTSFQVLEIQEDLSEAQSSEVAAVIGYRQALTAFYVATGEILDRYDIELQEKIVD